MYLWYAFPFNGSLSPITLSTWETPVKYIKQVEETLLAPASVTENHIISALGGMMTAGVDFADLYFQLSFHEAWLVEDGIVKEGSHNLEKGVGARAVSGDKVGFAYADDIASPALIDIASAAKSIVRQGETNTVAVRQKNAVTPLYPSLNPLRKWQDRQKVSFLKELDLFTRTLDPRIKQVTASLSSTYDVILVAASDGAFASDVRPLVRCNVSVIVEEKGRRESGSSGGGARLDYDMFIENNLAEDYAREAVRQALVNLAAVPAPAGQFPIVLGPGWPGVLLHEAVGHGLEGDFNRKGTSAFAGRMGEMVANPLVTVVDDGTLENRRGTLTIDDEGVQSECTTLIEKGRLVGYMQDKMNANLMGTKSTGNGRRESYAHLPMPRMTNTYMLQGKHTQEEMIASIDKGIFAANFGGGQVDITSGQFVFSASEAYLIEKGKITKPIKGATLIGNGPDIMQKVVMVGQDLKLDSGVGVCGKDGQSVPVGVGQPSLKISQITVGGTEVK